ncbi:hypothetical protein LTR16_001508 [Cryomyces antarcticus]|uniref:4-coumarate-CoA ligase n=1 Tax=Cryomyces antarcticus TaxID=329879 RepID=A0ABR0M866_9PEZI|nr:hypothetical protein LTR60_000821 [Cryomyces antarcticus]KAK5293587.1 hypothetical protein LTR16_001508 [Cryomyces antarcticus]
MPFTSPFPPLDIPKTDILSYLFPPNSTPSNEPRWIDSSNPEESLSARQLLSWVKRLAVGLDKLGVKPGEVVMIYTPNHIFVPAAYLGIVYSEPSELSSREKQLNLSEMIHQVKNTEAQIILAHPSLVKTAVAAARGAGLPDGRVFLFSDKPNDPIDGIVDWRTMIGSIEEGDRYSWKKLTDEESVETVATINYSSGTTGLPKGVCVSHRNLIANVEQTIFMRDLYKPYGPHNRPQERWVGFLPLYHAYGQLYTILMAAKLKVPVYVMKNFVYEDFLRVIQAHKITHLQVAPPILVMLSKRPETVKYDLSSVTDILCGAAPLSKALQNDVAGRFKVQINQGWGMTEVTCGALHVPGGTRDDTGSVGFLDPNCVCKLLDDNGKEVAMGEPGELYIRGPNVCLRYWKNDAATAESICSDGWLKTGDVAIVKNDWFWIVDRKKELIKVNALQVAPAELEAVLLEHDDVADAAVVGITLHDEEWPRAYVALKDEAKGKVTPDHIHSWMKDRVAKHKRLVGGIAFIDEVPKLASGKIQRKVMREWSKRDAPGIEREGSVRAKL